jgi:hypothetical protein
MHSLVSRFSHKDIVNVTKFERKLLFLTMNPIATDEELSSAWEWKEQVLQSSSYENAAKKPRRWHAGQIRYQIGIKEKREKTGRALIIVKRIPYVPSQVTKQICSPNSSAEEDSIWPDPASQYSTS